MDVLMRGDPALGNISFDEERFNKFGRITPYF